MYSLPFRLLQDALRSSDAAAVLPGAAWHPQHSDRSTEWHLLHPFTSSNSRCRCMCLGVRVYVCPFHGPVLTATRWRLQLGRRTVAVRPQIASDVASLYVTRIQRCLRVRKASVSQYGHTLTPFGKVKQQETVRECVRTRARIKCSGPKTRTAPKVVRAYDRAILSCGPLPVCGWLDGFFTNRSGPCRRRCRRRHHP